MIRQYYNFENFPFSMRESIRNLFSFVISKQTKNVNFFVFSLRKISREM